MHRPRHWAGVRGSPPHVGSLSHPHAHAPVSGKVRQAHEKCFLLCTEHVAGPRAPMEPAACMRPLCVCRWELHCLGPGRDPQGARDGGLSMRLPSDDGFRPGQPTAWALQLPASTHHIGAGSAPRDTVVGSRDHHPCEADLSTPLLAREHAEAVAVESRAVVPSSASGMQPTSVSVQEEELQREAAAEEAVSWQRHRALHRCSVQARACRLHSRADQPRERQCSRHSPVRCAAVVPVYNISV